jgi:hypothetical protein
MNRNTTTPTIRIVSPSVLVILQRVFHEHRRVVGQAHVDVLGQGGPEALHLVAQPVRDFDLVLADQGPHAEVDRLLVAELRDHVGLFGAKLDARHVAQAHDGAPAVGDDQVLEFVRGA